MTAIRAIGTYLPVRTVGNDELIERFGWDREFLEDKLGIHQRHIVAMTELGQAKQQLWCQKWGDVFKHD